MDPVDIADPVESVDTPVPHAPSGHVVESSPVVDAEPSADSTGVVSEAALEPADENGPLVPEVPTPPLDGPPVPEACGMAPTQVPPTPSPENSA